MSRSELSDPTAVAGHLLVLLGVSAARLLIHDQLLKFSFILCVGLSLALGKIPVLVLSAVLLLELLVVIARVLELLLYCDGAALDPTCGVEGLDLDLV